PVIIAGIILGVKGGAIVGGMFGICSIISNTIAPGITSFCFSPFYSIGEFHGGFNSIIIAMVPRILLGVISALVYSVLKKHFNEYVSVIVAALSGAITNTILVLGGIYVFFGASYAAAKEISYEALLGVLMSVVSVNGLLEAAFGAIIVLAVYKACKPIINKVRN
ncbi:MAG: ECF transporter S component, partial [Erysipelotrichaceae bacterium]